MATPDPRTPDSPTANKGCNMVALLIVLVALIVFVVAAWISTPSSAPDPINTGSPPAQPSSAP